jgi:hypothetical protein
VSPVCAGWHVAGRSRRAQASPPRLPRSPDFRSGPEQFPRSRVIYFGGGNFHEGAVMGGLYLGIAVTGVNALVATGLVIALM